MGRSTLLTPEVQKSIVAYIRSGAFDWIAAQAAGISPRTFRSWMKQGEDEKSGSYREFHEAVAGARAEARVTAEVEVRKQNPLAWLRYGPGRERPGQPGWTESQIITGDPDAPIAIIAGPRKRAKE